MTDFQALRGAIGGEPHRLIFFAFDLLHLDGADFRNRSLEERRARLEALIGPPDPAAAIQYSEEALGDGPKVFATAEAIGLEGIVSKRLSSRYTSGTTHDWLKTKAIVESEFVVVGVEPNPGGPPFALLARESPAGLVYVGCAFVTLPKAERDQFWAETEKLKTARPSLSEIRKRERLRGPQHDAIWADELAAWADPQAAWDMAMFGLRLGDLPQAMVSTTPKPLPIIRELISDPRNAVTRGTTWDNRAHLAKSFFDHATAQNRRRCGSTGELRSRVSTRGDRRLRAGNRSSWICARRLFGTHVAWSVGTEGCGCLR